MLGYCPRTLSVLKEADSFPRALLEETEALGELSFEEQIMSKDKYPSIFSESIGGYCVYYPSNTFRNTRNFEDWGIMKNYSPKWR